MTREAMIAKLMWNAEDAGFGFGICSVGASMAWAMDAPGPNKPDLPSIVLIGGPPDKYTDDELAKLVAFSEQATADYDSRFRYRRGANLLCINKSGDGRWLRKRMTWEIGPMYSITLDHAIAVLARKVGEPYPKEESEPVPCAV